MNLTLEVVHVNHCFRPGAAEEDQKYVEDLCRRKGIRCWTFVEDCNALAEELNMTGKKREEKLATMPTERLPVSWWMKALCRTILRLPRDITETTRRKPCSES